MAQNFTNSFCVETFLVSYCVHRYGFDPKVDGEIKAKVGQWGKRGPSFSTLHDEIVTREDRVRILETYVVVLRFALSVISRSCLLMKSILVGSHLLRLSTLRNTAPVN